VPPLKPLIGGAGLAVVRPPTVAAFLVGKRKKNQGVAAAVYCDKRRPERAVEG